MEYSCTDQVNRSAYYLYGNLRENFPSNSTGLVFFCSPKTGMGLRCAIYNFRRKRGTDNPNRWFRKFRSFRWKREKKVIPRRCYLSPCKLLNCPWNYRIYRTSCKRSRTTLSGRRSVAPGKFSTETTQKVVFRLLLPTVFSGHFLLMINNQHLHDFHGGLLWTSRRFHGFFPR